MKHTQDIRQVHLADIQPNPWNPHSSTDDEMEGIIESIAVKGFVGALVLVEFDRPVHYDGKSIDPTKPYLLVDGEQRFTAARAAFMRGLTNSDKVHAAVLGKLSDFTEAELAELGQMLNHKRGSREDVAKTGVIVEWLTKRASIEQVASTLGQNKEFLKQAMAQRIAQTRPQAAAAARPAGYQERKALNVVLPFATEEEVDEFETLVGAVANAIEAPTTKGSKRSAAVVEALKRYVGNG